MLCFRHEIELVPCLWSCLKCWLDLVPSFRIWYCDLVKNHIDNRKHSYIRGANTSTYESISTTADPTLLTLIWIYMLRAQIKQDPGTLQCTYNTYFEKEYTRVEDFTRYISKANSKTLRTADRFRYYQLAWRFQTMWQHRWQQGDRSSPQVPNSLAPQSALASQVHSTPNNIHCDQ